MERISVFDIFKLGIGPSSSHTLGPWRAALRFAALNPTEPITVTLLGSLAKTGHGHGTDLAIALGLSGADPETIDPAIVTSSAEEILTTGLVILPTGREAPLTIVFDPTRAPLQHPNTLIFESGSLLKTFFSIGGGFIRDAEEDSQPAKPQAALPFPIDSGADLARYCAEENQGIAEIVFANETFWNSPEEIRRKLNLIGQEMIACAHRGCHREGILPGGLEVPRRAARLHARLFGKEFPDSPERWLDGIRHSRAQFTDVLKWVSCFALAVNEENASFGRVVTAPTNGAAGVIPAVLLYRLCFVEEPPEEDTILHFLLVAAEIGCIFKKGATLSAAMGGCQAEIGVSSAMAAAALCSSLGGTPAQSLMAAEIAMEHHLGLTCDPIGGLVQIPCIERNTMGAVKAITAANIALESDPSRAKISLDQVVRTMWLTALDMNSKYKETSEGGLALSIAIPEC